MRKQDETRWQEEEQDYKKREKSRRVEKENEFITIIIHTFLII